LAWLMKEELSLNTHLDLGIIPCVSCGS
jgi:hypothetical protein